MKSAITLLLTILLISCAPPRNDELATQQINTIASRDLTVIVEDVESSELLETPHYEIKSLEYFPKSVYSYKVEVDFYFLKDNSFRIERKYRYSVKASKWELYYNEYAYIHN